MKHRFVALNDIIRCTTLVLVAIMTPLMTVTTFSSVTKHASSYRRMASLQLAPVHRQHDIQRMIQTAITPNIINPGIYRSTGSNDAPLFGHTKSAVVSATIGTRLYHSSPQRNFLGNNNRNNKNDNDEGSIVTKVKNIAKSILPSKWFLSDEERRRLAEEKEIQKGINTGIQQMFKDAPLPIRMVTNMIGPIFGSMMSSLAETAASQQSMIDVVYDQAVQSIQTDPSVQGLLGDTITAGRPFSQSSSSSSINGVTSTRIELAFPVAGRVTSGIGRLVASGGSEATNSIIIENLVVQSNGREITVNLRATKSERMTTGKPNSAFKNDGNIIDAEIIEKDTKNTPSS